jgi:TolB-like protein/class 3 adenylate cyclase/Tfp pilus assembly protein PilF
LPLGWLHGCLIGIRLAEMKGPEHGKLAAIVFTDVAGYSARVQRDEAGTLALVQADFGFMRSQCANHGGEVLNTMGDGMLMCFPSAAQAVMCALSIQEELGRRRDIKPPEEALEHRIGIHLGDVVRQAGQVVGDGVNIAARLQGKAPPGGICISKIVRDTVGNKVPIQAKSLGLQRFKNLGEPIAVYTITSQSGRSAVAPARSRAAWRWWCAAALAALGVASYVYFHLGPAAPNSPQAAVPGNSVALLPFTNMSEDKENAFFSDGVHEDLLTALANLGGLRVISRTSVMQYRDTTKTVRQIGAELGVAYLLEGSVQRVGSRVRVTGQLIDARTDEHVWAKAYDRDLTDVFAIQSELATEIADSLHAVLSPMEKAALEERPTSSVAAYDLFLRARDILRSDENIRDKVAQVQPLLERAVQLDPRFTWAWAQLGNLHLSIYRSLERTPQRLAKSKEAIDAAARLDPESPEVIMAFARYDAACNDTQAAEAAYRQLVLASPNSASALTGLATYEEQLGKWTEAFDTLNRARALDPRGADTLGRCLALLFLTRHYDERRPLFYQMAAVRPPDIQLSGNQAMVTFMATGATAEMEALLAAQPPSERLANHDVIDLFAEWYYYQGDAAAVIRLWEGSGPNWQFGWSDARYDLISVAAAYLKLGDQDKARPLLERNRDLLAKQLAQEPDNAFKWCDLGLTYAMLGEKKAALDLIPKVRELVAQSNNVIEVANREADIAIVLAWCGEKDKALAEIAPVLRKPSNNLFARVNVMRNAIPWRPLQGDPRFSALLDDPANNAPLF